MALNFKMRLDRQNENLCLELKGDFDGSSAMQLLFALRHHMRGAGKVIVETDTLSCLETFGLNVFHYNLGDLRRVSKRIVFTGKYAQTFTELWPEGREPFFQ